MLGPLPATPLGPVEVDRDALELALGLAQVREWDEAFRGEHTGTFLPSVWKVLPEPRIFLRRLKEKAGLDADHWSPTLGVERYTAESFS